MKLIDRVFEYIRDNPDATYKDIKVALDIASNVLSTYISRLIKDGNIIVKELDGVKTYVVIKERDKALKENILLEQAKYKKEIYQKMLDAYMDDFSSATGFNERVEIGKLILRLLEKI